MDDILAKMILSNKTYLPSCKYNCGVWCESSEQNTPGKCDRCGWNPVEADRRKKELRERIRKARWEKEQNETELIR